jgi:hypothetical protein
MVMRRIPVFFSEQVPNTPFPTTRTYCQTLGYFRVPNVTISIPTLTIRRQDPDLRKDVELILSLLQSDEARWRPRESERR